MPGRQLHLRVLPWQMGDRQPNHHLPHSASRAAQANRNLHLRLQRRATVQGYRKNLKG